MAASRRLRPPREFPVRLIESGPVAGAKVAQPLSQALWPDDVSSFDMGGTTAKACLIRGGRMPMTDELEVARSRRFTKSSGYPGSGSRRVNMIEIGAGGGSIAAGRPARHRSGRAGERRRLIRARPATGAAAQRPTVTDADLCLGYSTPIYFAGGTMRLDADAARAAIERDVARPTARDILAAAWIDARCGQRDDGRGGANACH